MKESDSPKGQRQSFKSRAVNDVFERVHRAQVRLNAFVKKSPLIDQVQTIARTSARKAKVVINADIEKLGKFLNKEVRQIEKLQARLPQEVSKMREFLKDQKSALDSILVKLQKQIGPRAGIKVGKKVKVKKASGPGSSSKRSKGTVRSQAPVVEPGTPAKTQNSSNS